MIRHADPRSRARQALVAPKTPQGVLVRGHAGLVINEVSQRDKGIGPTPTVLAVESNRV